MEYAQTDTTTHQVNAYAEYEQMQLRLKRSDRDVNVQNLVYLYHENKEQIAQMRKKGICRKVTIKELTLSQQNKFIEKYGLDSFLHYLTSTEVAIIELDEAAKMEYENEQLLDRIVYLGANRTTEAALIDLGHRIDSLITTKKEGK